MDVRIELGARVITQLKALYWPNDKWCVKISNYLSKRLSELKIRVKPYYPDLDDEELLKVLSKYSTDDIEDAFTMEN